jgi:hypothetical protein
MQAEVLALRKFRDSVATALESLEHDLRSAQPARPQTRPEQVLVRFTPGPPVKVFHSMQGACGRVKVRESFQAISYRQALTRGLRQCAACDWTVV